MAEFIKCINMKGFDRHRTPRWQMVPVYKDAGDDRYVALRAGTGLTVTSSNTARLKVEEVSAAVLPAGYWGHEREPLLATDRIFKLTGLARGDAEVLAKTGATLSVKLEVDVKARKTLKVAFNFVKDKDGRHTRFVPANAAEWVKTINYILKNQANVEVTSKFADWINLDVGLGKQLDTITSGVGEEKHLYKKEDPHADRNIFFVWELDITDSKGDEAAFRDGNRIVVEDETQEPMGEVLAHELCHSMGLPDQYTTPRELMYGDSPSGIHLPKGDVNKINP